MTKPLLILARRGVVADALRRALRERADVEAISAGPRSRCYERIIVTFQPEDVLPGETPQEHDRRVSQEELALNEAWKHRFDGDVCIGFTFMTLPELCAEFEIELQHVLESDVSVRTHRKAP
jgi:hypothetical protein